MKLSFLKDRRPQNITHNGDDYQRWRDCAMKDAELIIGAGLHVPPRTNKYSTKAMAWMVLYVAVAKPPVMMASTRTSAILL